MLFQERLYETLLERFCRNESYNEDQLARTFHQLFSALDWIHHKGFQLVPGVFVRLKNIVIEELCT